MIKFTPADYCILSAGLHYVSKHPETWPEVEADVNRMLHKDTIYPLSERDIDVVNQRLWEHHDVNKAPVEQNPIDEDNSYSKRLVEIWTIGGLDSTSFVIIEPVGHKNVIAENGYNTHEGVNGYVINGCYYVRRDKEKNIMRIFGAPGGEFETESHYLGDIEGKGDYNSTIQAYEDTRTVVGKNLIKIKILKDPYDPEHDEPPF